MVDRVGEGETMAMRRSLRSITGTNFSFFKKLLPDSRRGQNSSMVGRSSQASSARSQAPILTFDSGRSAVELGAPSNSRSMELSDPDLENGLGSISGEESASPHPTIFPTNIPGAAAAGDPSAAAAAAAAGAGAGAGAGNPGPIAADDGQLGKVKKAAKFVCSLTLSLFAGIIISVVINMRKAAKNGKELGFYKGSAGVAIFGSASDVGLLVSVLMEAGTTIDGEGLKKWMIRFMVVSVAVAVVAIGLLGLNVVF